MRNFWKSENGDTNFVSIIILLILMIVAVALFGPYVSEFVSWLSSMLE